MRLWPHQMLDVLPTKQLVAQWRECLAIAGSIKLNSKVNHSIVNYVNNYSIENLVKYSNMVELEFKNRNFTIGKNTLEKMNNDINYDSILQNIENNFQPFKFNHNNRYIKQCLYKFQLKYDLGYTSEREWKLLKQKFCNLINDEYCNIESKTLLLLINFKILEFVEQRYINLALKEIYYFLTDENLKTEEEYLFIKNYCFLIYTKIGFDNIKFRNKDILNKIKYLIKDMKSIDYGILNKYHNDRYLKQCLYDFQEKYDCNMLDDVEWKTLQNKFSKFINF